MNVPTYLLALHDFQPSFTTPLQKVIQFFLMWFALIQIVVIRFVLIWFAGTASYYKRLGLIDESVDITDEETDINILFEMALQRLVFLPFGYLVSILSDKM